MIDNNDNDETLRSNVRLLYLLIVSPQKSNVLTNVGNDVRKESLKVGSSLPHGSSVPDGSSV